MYLTNSSMHMNEVQINDCSFSVDAYRQKIVKDLYEFMLLWISLYFSFVINYGQSVIL